MKQLQFRLVGKSPLLLHNGQMANPLNKFVRELNTLTKKGRGIKEEAVLEEIAQLEFLGSLYTSDDVIGIPGNVIFTVLRNGARKFKQGKTIEAGLVVNNFYPLIYDGPKDPQELFDHENGSGERPFVDQRMVKIGGRSSILRTRPIFIEWAIDIEIEVDESVIEPDNVIQIPEGKIAVRIEEV